MVVQILKQGVQVQPQLSTQQKDKPLGVAIPLVLAPAALEQAPSVVAADTETPQNTDLLVLLIMETTVLILTLEEMITEAGAIEVIPQ